MNPHDEPTEELLKAYEEASAKLADRLSDATRNAILAEASAAARRRTPAANDARYVWRAVAGVAVFGIALLLWRQSNVPTEIAAPATEVVAASRAKATAEPIEQAPAQNRKAVQDRVAPRDLIVAQEEAPAAPRAFAEERSAELGLGAASAAAAAARSAQVAEASVSDFSDFGLLQEYFPQLVGSQTPRSVWVVLNGGGQLQSSGELISTQSLTDIAPEPWERSSVINARGQKIEIAVHRMP
jgi:hypothetical protein